MADNRTMANVLTSNLLKGTEDAISVHRQCHNFELTATVNHLPNSTTRYFYNSLSSNDQDALDYAAWCIYLDKTPQDGLASIESKSKGFVTQESRANDSRQCVRRTKMKLVYYDDNLEKNKERNFVHAISIIDFSKNDPFSGSTTSHSDDPSLSSSPVKTSDNFVVKFA
ncbi:hypothetical protein Tco_0775136 [Tanacetum coccineum]|uniref:Uncharacterized protein n=1 Tax=Tanacetum coccineum TaxID=301880 RepID=A0ABQ4YJW9_9ASTR